MLDLNKVFIVGRLTKKPDLRYLPSGSAIAELDIAYNRYMKATEGKQARDEAHFFRVKVFGKVAEFAGEYLDKGRAVYVEGRLVQEKWETKDTKENRSRIVILGDRLQFAESKKQEAGGGDEISFRKEAPSHQSQSQSSPSEEDGVGDLSSSGSEGGEGNTTNDLPF